MACPNVEIDHNVREHLNTRDVRKGVMHVKDTYTRIVNKEPGPSPLPFKTSGDIGAVFLCLSSLTLFTLVASAWNDRLYGPGNACTMSPENEAGKALEGAPAWKIRGQAGDYWTTAALQKDCDRSSGSPHLDRLPSLITRGFFAPEQTAVRQPRCC